MTKPTFFITTDETTHIQGETTELFKALGVASARLESYDHQGDYVDLTYTGGLNLAIPEYRVRRIGRSASVVA
ncbi:hypothetical protein OG875_04985 [Streptomyces sp. NBC_01498]|uniref:hypothetical protein n=1 Tax=Streptomyces sp. NBC_01498 TaxID=2975870 RepID=UPI002E7B8DC1|nr:hypothetical protein [Streptomyces sp. NBC_01498]WTL24012.1 hypothetical protein OG875_04985 [Streptomyces sp. NBC_01498]